jgi:lipopolysaccharide/colanic/teichoic acid biosynthesis glycosyltransferase
MGHMSLVGPRPDVPEAYVGIAKQDRDIVLSVRPGLSGPATLRYRDEEKLLAIQKDPERYSQFVIFPDKIRINRDYVENYNLFRDLLCLLETLLITSTTSVEDLRQRSEHLVHRAA